MGDCALRGLKAVDAWGLEQRVEVKNCAFLFFSCEGTSRGLRRGQYSSGLIENPKNLVLNHEKSFESLNFRFFLRKGEGGKVREENRKEY